MSECIVLLTIGSESMLCAAVLFVCALAFVKMLHSSGGGNGGEETTDSQANTSCNQNAMQPALGCKRLETKFDVTDEALRSKIVAHMHHFGTPCALAESMNGQETEETMLETSADCKEMQLVMNIAIEDDEEAWRPMHVHVALAAEKLTVRLLLPRVAAPSVSTPSCEFLCKVAMRNAFLQEMNADVKE